MCTLDSLGVYAIASRVLREGAKVPIATGFWALPVFAKKPNNYYSYLLKQNQNVDFAALDFSRGATLAHTTG